MNSELPPLSSASSFTDLSDNKDGDVTEIHYKSGGVYKGMVKNNHRSGKGIFTWTDGSWYDGEYLDNQRSGYGKQLFRDGSLYEGEFLNDLREGIGTQTYISKEVYEGSFYKDFRHGNGKYFWPESTQFKGMFYLSKKEGYGTFTSKNGNVFEGLYKEDERLGPGILSYSSSNLQDVGLWHGEKLIRIAFTLCGGFTLLQHSHCIRLLQEKDHRIHMADCWKTDTLFEEMCQENTYYDILSSTQLSEKLKDIYIDYQDKSSWKINYDTFNENFVSAAKGTLDLNDSRGLWNLTPFLVELQNHSLKHSFKQDLIKVNAIFHYDREKFLAKGIMEKSSETLLKSAFAGDHELVEAILEENIVSPDVSDRYGIHSLIIATSIGNDEIIEILLNCGANVNQLSDEGCSALTVGIIHCYPSHLFPENIQIHKVGYLPNYSVGRENEKPCIPLCYSNIFDINDTLFWPESMDHTVDIPSQTSATIISKVIAADNKGDQWQDSAVMSTLLSKQSNYLQKDSNYLRKSLPDNNKLSPNVAAYDETADERNTKSLTLQTDFAGNKMVDVKDALGAHVELKAEDLISKLEGKKGKSETLNVPGASLKDTGSNVKLPKKVSFKDVSQKEEFNIKDNKYRTCVNLLLQRGADPNAAYYPWPVLYFAIRAADVEMARSLLLKNASTSVCLSDEEGGVTPLHVACGMPGKEGIQMTELLLNSLADPNARAALDNSYLNTALREEWQLDNISPEAKLILGGRTPLHIACARNDNYEDAAAIVRLLLEKKANPNVSTNGFSPLALAIAWGNKLAVTELLNNGAEPNLELTHGIGNSLCVAVTTQFEDQWNLEDRFELIETLLKHGANILREVPTGAKRVMSSVVDYAHYMFNLDSRIAHLPYHALTASDAKAKKSGKGRKAGRTGKAGKAGRTGRTGRASIDGKFGRFGKAGNIGKITKSDRFKHFKKGSPFKSGMTFVPGLSDRVLSREEVYGSNYSHN
ncbi:ankyrin repeat and MYND domain-containing protein 1-like [Octopus vulgaris]|uniref:Ankyrin repeat and MYND domain-containing protein 1-like n=1 Tax=Octopus vulgaris TaxID=6645 RepID=A0AA36B1N4_OCTVU|nr:ankyrin repeat and MYND domain-containing protein 1-like [Octopus vulgaris]